MQNCYNTNARGQQPPRAPDGEEGSADDRLTRRHIETLQFAQDLARQNRDLKEAAARLEARLADCEPAHRMADEAQQRLQDMQERCNQRVDEVARRLAEQHEREMAAVLQDRAEDERAWYAARQREQTELLKMQMDLRDQEELAARLQARISEQTGALAAEAEKAVALEAAVVSAAAERDAARRALASAEARQRASELARHELHAERQKCAELQLRLDQLLRDRQADSQAEAEHQRCLDDCQRQLGDLRLEAERTELRLAETERRVAEERQLAERLEAENAALRADVAALRAQLQTANAAAMSSSSLSSSMPGRGGKSSPQQLPPPAGDANFREFVAVKRELSALREENERLRGRMRTAATAGGGGPAASSAASSGKKA